MGNEATKAHKRRLADSSCCWENLFAGDGIDIGCGHDPVTSAMYPKIKNVIKYDSMFGHQDAMTLPEIADASLDFVHSSHCLEHLPNPFIAIRNWLRVLKVSGYIICTIPDEVMYEHGHWPSHFNGDHKVAFTLREPPVINHAYNVCGLLRYFGKQITIITCQDITNGYNSTLPDNIDQTGFDHVECAIEFVVRKEKIL